jgi:predicted oxidoreductase
MLGTTNPGWVKDSAAGSDAPLTRQEWYRLFTAAGHSCRDLRQQPPCLIEAF